MTTDNPTPAPDLRAQVRPGGPPMNYTAEDLRTIFVRSIEVDPAEVELMLAAGADAMDKLAAAEARIKELVEGFSLMERERDSWKAIAEERGQEAEADDTVNGALRGRIKELEADSLDLGAILEIRELIMGCTSPIAKGYGKGRLHEILDAALARREAAKKEAEG